MAEDLGQVDTRVEDDVFWIELGGMDGATHTGLTRVFRRAYESDTRVVVVTGKDETFLGPTEYDLDWLKEYDDYEIWMEDIGEAEEILEAQLNVDKPMIAKVYSPGAHSVGASLALACDLIIASEDATFCDPHCPGFAVPPGDGGALLWPARIGLGRAKEFLLTGREMTAGEAEEIGLITRAVPEEDLDEEVDELVDRLASLSQPAVRATKKWLNQYIQHDMDVVGRGTLYMEGFMGGGTDFEEARAAIQEGREPDFPSGR